MKYSILAGWYIILALSACSQSRTLQKAYAFSQHINYGTVAVDDKGKQLTPASKTNRFIYLEYKSSTKLNISEVLFNNIVHKNPSVYLIGQKTLQVGNSGSNNKKIILTPAKGNSIWKLEFSSVEENENDENDNKTQPTKIIIRGLKDGRPFTLTINNIIELTPIRGV